MRGGGGLLDLGKPTIGTLTPHGKGLTRVQALPPSLPVSPSSLTRWHFSVQGLGRPGGLCWRSRPTFKELLNS